MQLDVYQGNHIKPFNVDISVHQNITALKFVYPTNVCEFPFVFLCPISSKT